VTALAGELKRLCGSGGAVKDGVVEIQGDHRAKVIAHLEGRYTVKAAGG
jgi:translation initiation factor 1